MPSDAPPTDTPPVVPPTAVTADAPALPTPPPVAPENDPNHQMALLIAKRAERKAAKPEVEDDAEQDKGKPAAAKEAQKGSEKLGDLISDALRFGKDKPKAKIEPAKEPEAKPEGTPAVAPPAVPPPAPTVIKKKAPEPAPFDPGEVASRAAAAATTAAVQAMQPRQAPPQEPDLGEALKPSDRHKYEVAKFLAKQNPHYKNAPRQVLDQVKRAEQYASRWETANPGKLFNPEDDDHNEFYDSLDDPWTDTEFSKAERAIERELIKEELKKEYDGEIASIKETNARLELASNVDQKFNQAIGQLITGLGEDVDKAIKSGGVEKLEEQDPITATLLLQTVEKIKPLIETIVQIDDPKGRIQVDMNNPLHQQWSEIVAEGEKVCAGHRLPDGRVFARRAEYIRMNDAQRATHWFLTTDNIISGVVDKASKYVSELVKTEKERQIKIAHSLGFIPKNGSVANSGASSATNGSTKEDDEPASTTTKPTSPSAGAGAKVGDQPTAPLDKKAKLVDAMANILRGR